MKISEFRKTMSNLVDYEKKYLSTFVGGVSATKEEKENSLKIINEAINNNKNGVLTHVDVEEFAIAYPESMNLFEAYYTSYNALSNDKDKKLSNIERRYGLLIFAPMIIVENDKDATLENAKKFGANGSDLGFLRTQYKGLFGMIKECDSSNILSLFTLVKNIEDDILFENKTKYQIFNDYNIDSKRLEQCILLSQYKDKLKEILLENSFGYYDNLSELFEMVPHFLKNGIQYGDDNIKFTLLDWYYLTGEDVKKFIDEYKHIYIAKNEQDVMNELNKLKNNMFYLGRSHETCESMVNSGIKVNEQVVDLEFSKKLMSIFTEFNIPVRDALVQIATSRYSNGLPILPIEELRKDKVQCKEKEKVLVYSKGE